MLDLGWLPVFAPVAMGESDGLSYNINADMVAQAIAGALGDSELVFVSNVPGVILDGHIAPRLDAAAIEAAIARGGHQRRHDPQGARGPRRTRRWRRRGAYHQPCRLRRRRHAHCRRARRAVWHGSRFHP